MATQEIIGTMTSTFHHTCVIGNSTADYTGCVVYGDNLRAMYDFDVLYDPSTATNSSMTSATRASIENLKQWHIENNNVNQARAIDVLNEMLR